MLGSGIRFSRDEVSRLSLLTTEQAAQTRWLVLITGIATTLIVWTSLTDPINLPKMFVLTIFSAWVLGSVVMALISKKGIKLSLGQWAISAFALGILIAALLTDVTYTAFFGTAQRNDGAFSYLALATLCIAAMMSFGPTNIGQVRTGFLATGLVLTTYGLLQTSGHDPFKWVLLYGPVVGTLGNPDFMSGFIGVSAIATLWVIFTKGKLWFRGAAIVLLFLELLVIKRTGSIQGFPAFAVGLTLLAIVKLWQVRKSFGITVSLLAGVVGIPVLLGLLNKGPLAAKIYRATLSNRIDYWHAALNMFKAHPFAGVGLDRLGDSYGQYAPQVQVAQGQTTDNAHNVFLQLLATGGLIVILPYLFLLGVILWTALRGIRHSTGETQINIVALFSIWFALLLVSCVSIDDLGVAVWFWISGGALYGVARYSLAKVEDRPIKKQKSGKSTKRATPNSSSYFAPVASLVIMIMALIIMVPAWRSSAMLLGMEQNTYRLSPSQFVDRMNQIAKIETGNTRTLIVLSDIALRISRVDLAIDYAKGVNQLDPRSSYGNELSAKAYESAKKYAQAIPFRVRLTELDRWNTTNMLTLVKDYVQVKDLANARAIAARISTLRPGGDDAKAAIALVNG